MRGCGKRVVGIATPEERTPTLETRFSRDVRTVQPYSVRERASPHACENRVGTKRPVFASAGPTGIPGIDEVHERNTQSVVERVGEYRYQLMRDEIDLERRVD